jgi:hypothetical protein
MNIGDKMYWVNTDRYLPPLVAVIVEQLPTEVHPCCVRVLLNDGRTTFHLSRKVADLAASLGVAREVLRRKLAEAKEIAAAEMARLEAIDPEMVSVHDPFASEGHEYQ